MRAPPPFVTLTLGILCLMGQAIAAPENAAGRQLAQAIYDNPTGRDFASRGVMLIEQKGRSPRKRTLFTYTLERAEAERWSLTRFTSPADIRGVGLLTKDYPGDQNDQWLYLPALDRVRRISSGRKGGRFVGSDLFFEDLRDREVSMDHHFLKGEGRVGKIKTKVLVSTPVDPDNSVYTKRVSWVHPKTLIALRVDLYQADSNKPVKRLSVKRLKRIQGFWTILDSVMEDLKSGSTTRIALTKVKYNQGIAERLFSSQSLADENAETAYRP